MSRWFTKGRLIALIGVALFGALTVQGYLLHVLSIKPENRKGQSLTSALAQSGISTHSGDEWMTLPGMPTPYFGSKSVAPTTGADSNSNEPFADPFAEMQRVRQEMDRVTNQAFSPVGGIPTPTMDRLTFDLKNSPQLQIEDKRDHYLITSRIPGTKFEDLKIELENDLLTISGMRHDVSSSTSHGVVAQNTTAGTFQNSLMLPGPTDCGSMNASMKDDVLTITVKKK